MAIRDHVLGRLEAQNAVAPSLERPTGVEATTGPIATTGLNGGQRQVPLGDALAGADQRLQQPTPFGRQFGTARGTSPPVKAVESFPGALSGDLSGRPPAEGLQSMVRQLLAKGHVVAARKLVYAIPRDRGALEPLRRLRVVLGEPIVRRKGPAYDGHARNLEWLRKNAVRYSGKWVALANGRLVAVDRALAPLRRTLRRRAPDVKPFLHRL